MKKIVVTGGAGFIGSAFVRTQLADYPDLHITTFDKMTYAGNLENLKDLDSSRHTFVKGDIADIEALRAVMNDCDAIVNFAADTHVDRSILGALDFISTNVTGVYNILEIAKEFGTERVLLVSTDEIYGSIEKGSFKESDPPSPKNPYSASKAGGELVALAHHNTYGTPVTITRGSNTYGPYQYPEKIMPLFITNLIDDQKVPLYSGGENNIRDWLYVDDHARGVDVALRKGLAGQVYNIAGDNERKNIDVTTRLLELCGKDESSIQLVKDRPGHDFRYSIDAGKLHKLGWAPTMDWDEGIQNTVDWYKKNEAWWRPIKSGEFREYYERQYGNREV